MKVLGVLCSCRSSSLSAKMVKEILRGAEAAGAETQIFTIGSPMGAPLRGCIGCHACKMDTDRFCVQKDVLTPYFEALPDADAVVLGAGIYMGYPQGEAWNFMNRHFCLHRKVMAKGADNCRIPAGKKLIPVFAQGAPDNPEYRKNYEALLAPFDGWGFVRVPAIVLSGMNAGEQLEKGFSIGKELLKK